MMTCARLARLGDLPGLTGNNHQTMGSIH